MSDFFSFSGKLDDIVLGFDSVDDYKVKLINLFTLLGLLASFFSYAIDVFSLYLLLISYCHQRNIISYIYFFTMIFLLVCVCVCVSWIFHFIMIEYLHYIAE